MIEVSYNEVSNIIKNNKFVMVFVLTNKDCPVCKDWIPDFFQPECKKRGIEIYKIIVEDNPEIIFPPANTPMIYFWVKDIPEPLAREGAGPEEAVIFDLDAIIKVANGATIEEAYNL